MSTQRLAFVTGGSKGLGKALCEHLQRDGWQVIEFSRSAPEAYSVAVDLSRPEAAIEVLRSTFEQHKSSNYTELAFFNNAGAITPIGPLDGSQSQAWIKHLNINVVSGMSAMGLFVSNFQDLTCKKTLVNISSGAAAGPLHGWSLYCGSKAGLELFVRTVALEQERETHPVTAINVSPGVIDTGMQASIRSSELADFPDLAKFQGYHESGALQSADNAAKPIIELLSKDLVAGECYRTAT